MKNSPALFLTLLFLIQIHFNVSAVNKQTLTSPDGQIKVEVNSEKGGFLYYAIYYKNNEVLAKSKLGLNLEDTDLSSGLKILEVSNISKVEDSYIHIPGKKHQCIYVANKQVFSVRNEDKVNMDIVFQVSNDGVAFRYQFDQYSDDLKKVLSESTSFNTTEGTKAWLHPHKNVKMDWCNTQPSYEESYYIEVDPDTKAPYEAGWSFPALFKSEHTWLLITESGLEPNYCGSRLGPQAINGEFSLQFPQPGETTEEDSYLLPHSTFPFKTPWRIVMVGNLGNIVESTLVTDLALPSAIKDASFVKPGRASWSWALLKDNSVVYDIQKLYIDLAATMGWEYCLIDVEWDQHIGYNKIQELVDYARNKNVGIILWYNSSGDWNTTTYSPKNMMYDAETRRNEFEKISKMGVVGVKVDFWAGDGQSVIQYYYDLLEDAAKYNLMVNTHGTTITRGWSRTFPNLVTMEAVKGFEFITFTQENADMAAEHCTVLPFTRNVVGPMDFTPMCFSAIPNIQKHTSNGFELALSVLFQSGIQHYAESPLGIAMLPGYVKSFLQNLPPSWDDVKFIDGYPGKYAVLARQADGKWYIGGINGSEEKISMNLDFSNLHDVSSYVLIKDGENANFMKKKGVLENGKLVIDVEPSQGFVMAFD